MIRYYKFIKVSKHEMQEIAEFHVDNVEYLVRKFMESICERKEIYAVGEEVESLLITQREQEMPINRLIRIKRMQDLEWELACQRAAGELFEKIMSWQNRLQKEKIEQLLEQPGSIMERKQTFSYEKAIKKKMQKCSKFFVDKRMEDYDFRELDLDGAIFFNCRLRRANFSYVNLENTLFINCDFTDAIFYKAHMENALVVYGECRNLKQLGVEGQYEE